VLRQEVEDFLFAEAALLDEWRLDEWLALLTDDVTYIVPATDARDAENAKDHPRSAMGENAAPAAHTDMRSPATTLHEATGKVESITDREVVLSHSPVKSLGWPAMTMAFKLARPEMARALKPGDTVHFEFRRVEDGFAIERLEKQGTEP